MSYSSSVSNGADMGTISTSSGAMTVGGGIKTDQLAVMGVALIVVVFLLARVK